MTRTNTNSSRAYHWLGRLKHTMPDITISILAAAGEDVDAPVRIFDTNLENSPPVFSWNLVALGYINLDLRCGRTNTPSSKPPPSPSSPPSIVPRYVGSSSLPGWSPKLVVPLCGSSDRYVHSHHHPRTPRSDPHCRGYRDPAGASLRRQKVNSGLLGLRHDTQSLEDRRQCVSCCTSNETVFQKTHGSYTPPLV